MAIPKIDYSKMELEELKALRDEVQANLTKAQEEQSAKALNEVMEKIELYGLSNALRAMLGKMVGRPRKNSNGDGLRASPAPKYRSLKDPSKTWTGRGVMSKWMKEEIAEAKKHGKKLTKEDFLIKENKAAA